VLARSIALAPLLFGPLASRQVTAPLLRQTLLTAIATISGTAPAAPMDQAAAAAAKAAVADDSKKTEYVCGLLEQSSLTTLNCMCGCSDCDIMV